MSVSGRLVGGKPSSRGALYLMLQNRIYRSKMVHKGQFYPGEHTPIVDHPLWDAVQGQLASRIAERYSGIRNHQPSLLADMLFDGGGSWDDAEPCRKDGHALSLLGRRLIDHIRSDRDLNRAADPCRADRASRSSQVHVWLLDPGSIYKPTSAQLADASTQQWLVPWAAEIGKHWPELLSVPMPVSRSGPEIRMVIKGIGFDCCET